MLIGAQACQDWILDRENALKALRVVYRRALAGSEVTSNPTSALELPACRGPAAGECGSAEAAARACTSAATPSLH